MSSKNLCVQLRLRQRNGTQKIRVSDFKLSKERAISIHSIIDADRELMRKSCVILGFSLDGYHLISYVQKENSRDALYTSEVEAFFFLQFWKFNLSKRLVKVCEIPLFGAANENLPLNIRKCSAHQREPGKIVLQPENHFGLQVVETRDRRAFIVCGYLESKFQSETPDDGNSKPHHFSILPSPIYSDFQPNTLFQATSFQLNSYFPFRRFDPSLCLWESPEFRSERSHKPFKIAYQTGTSLIIIEVVLKILSLPSECTVCKQIKERETPLSCECPIGERFCYCGFPPNLSHSYYSKGTTPDDPPLVVAETQILKEFDFEAYLQQSTFLSLPPSHSISAYDILPVAFYFHDPKYNVKKEFGSSGDEEKFVLQLSLLTEPLDVSDINPKQSITTTLLLYNISENTVSPLPNTTSVPAQDVLPLPTTPRTFSDLLPKFSNSLAVQLRRWQKRAPSGNRMLTNDSVVSGQSLSYLQHPFLPLIILGYRVRLQR